MTKPPPRRRPPPLREPDQTPTGDDSTPDDDGRAPNMLRGVLILGSVMIIGVFAIALITGTTDELPWGAIIGVLLIMGCAFVIGRRRSRALGPDGEDL